MFWKRLFCPPCLIILVLVLLVIGGYFLLRGGYQAPAPVVPEITVPEAPTRETPRATPPEEITPPSVSSEIKEFTVSGTEYRFIPSSITVKTGDQVRIIFRNNGRLRHNFVVSDIGVNTRAISGGETDTIEFAAPTSGTYTIICSVPGHRAAGMEGSLIVE